MAVNNVKRNGTVNVFKPEYGGTTTTLAPVIGVVKNNIDPTHTGMIDVYIAKQGGIDPDDSNNWTKNVKYLSPFYGISGSGSNPTEDGPKTGDGKFVGNPQSYGFWASAPDIGTEVVCIFINGIQDQGYYIGCVPKPGLLQMTPALGASSNVVPNEAEGASYGGVDRLPTSEVNYSNPAIKKSPQIYNEPKPIHSYQAAILAAQGLVRDNVRGVISSSAQRETPSRVFGLSTPGGPIFEGGFTNQTIKDAVKTAPPEKLKQVGRTGGHSFVMDDGTLTGQDQLIRLRSSAGHQITMSDTGQTLFIIHSNGQSWIEMGKEGTIDIYSTNSFNVRTQGDINFHADRDINLNAAKNLNMFGENINIESAKNYSQRVGIDFANYTLGKYTVKVDGAMSQQSSGQASYVSTAETFINGSKVNLNSGSASTSPQPVQTIPKTNHIDTINSPTVGWMNPSPNPLISVTNRAPAHQPWIGAGTGVDVKIESTATSAATQPTPAAAAVSSSAPPTPETPTTPAAVASVPLPSAATAPLTSATEQAMMAQIATTAQAAGGTAVNGVLNAATGLTTKMSEAAGVLKIGSSPLINDLQANGMPLAKAMTGMVTGTLGVSSPAQLMTSVSTGAAVVGTAINKSVTGLISAGVIAVKDAATQAAGAVMGAVTSGISAVTDLAKTGITAVTGLANSIAGGTFAAKLADGLSLGGLSTALGGMVSGLTGKLSSLGNSVASLEASLKSGLQSAFASVEKSFGTLKAGVANVLGPKTGASPIPPSDVAKAGDAFASAEAEVTSATDALLVAKRNYRNEQTPETTAALQTAESNLSAATQRKSQASTSFMKAVPGGAVTLPTVAGLSLSSALSGGITGAVNGAIGSATGAITGAVNGAIGGATSAITGAVNNAVNGAVGSATAAVQTTLTSGLNSLPGGPAILQSVVNNSPLGGAINSASTALGVVNSTLASVGGIAGNVDKLVGNLTGGVNGLVGDAMAKATGILPGALGDLKAGVSGIMGQLQTSMAGIQSGADAIKQAAAAVNTFDNSAIIAKTGQLLGDAKIPSPTSIFSSSPLPPGDATQASAEVTAALAAVKDAGYKVQSAKINLGITSKLGTASAIATAAESLAKEEEALKVAQDAYTSLVSGSA